MAIQLVQASTLAKQNGVKMLVYGPPGTGKTPICATAPRPVLCAVERGTLSLRNATNVAAIEARTVKALDEFVLWCEQSREAKNFDTICIDSISEVASVSLSESLAAKKHGQAAYGEMSEWVKKKFWNRLMALTEKHIYMIAKMDVRHEGETSCRAPMFPGQVLKYELQHDVDEVFHINRPALPEANYQPVHCLQTIGDASTIARDRSGKLLPYEKPDLGYIISKITAP